MADGAPQIRKAWDMVDEAKKQIDNLSPEQVKEELDNDRDKDNVVIVDIRDFRELYLRGKIPGAFHADRGMLEFWIDPASEYYRELFTPDKRFILYCAGGGRSALAAKTMRDMGYPNVAHLESGFGGWASAGMPVEDCKTGAKWVQRSDLEG
jgi:rhodanese-related sulfurtransferase